MHCASMVNSAGAQMESGFQDGFQFSPLLSRATGAVGLHSLLLLFTDASSDRSVVIVYSTITLIVAFALTFIHGVEPPKLSTPVQVPDQLV
jgi:hypothetical protein